MRENERFEGSTQELAPNEVGKKENLTGKLKERIKSTEFDGINENPEAVNASSRSSYIEEDEEMQKVLDERNLDISHESIAAQPPSLPVDEK